jgi:hypothetical protein
MGTVRSMSYGSCLENPVKCHIRKTLTPFPSIIHASQATMIDIPSESQ